MQCALIGNPPPDPAEHVRRGYWRWLRRADSELWLASGPRLRIRVDGSVVLVRWRVVLIVMLVLAAAPLARALLLFQTSASRLAVSSASLPAFLPSTSFSLAMWIWPDQPVTQTVGLFDVPGLFSLSASPAGITASVSSAQAGKTASVSLGQPLIAQEWSLVVVSVDRVASSMRVSHARGLLSPTSAQGSLASIASAPLGPAVADAAIGATSSGLASAIGVVGPVVIREGAVNATDVALLAQLRSPIGAITGDFLAQGGTMNGWPGAAWAVGHAVAASPFDGGVGGTPEQRASADGRQALTTNLCIYDRTKPVGIHWHDTLAVVRPATAAIGLQHVAANTGPWAGFFARDLESGPSAAISGDRFAHVLRQLVEGPIAGPVRIMTSANSRGVRPGDPAGQGPTNYQEGFFAELRPWVSGTMWRPATVGNWSAWFAFDCTSPPHTTGVVDRLDFAGTPWRDFSRLGTGSVDALAVGPGAGVVVRPASSFAMRAKPEPGSMMVADAPLRVEVHLAGFPGASVASVSRTRAASQHEPGTDDVFAVQQLDTTVLARVFGPGDAVLQPTLYRLLGDLTSVLTPGTLVVNTAAQPAPTAAFVTASFLDGSSTLVVLRHPPSTPPAVGDVLRIGPASVVTVAAEFDPVAPSDPLAWRGLRVAAQSGGVGVLVHALSAHRPNDPGLIIGSAGWSGHGYAQQLAESSDSAVGAWIAQTKADAWIVVPAQQGSTPASMSDWTAAIRAALPECDVLWAGEGAHAGSNGSTFIDWHQYIVDNAQARDVVALSVLDHPGIGTYPEQLCDGHRADPAHYSVRGNRALASAWLDRLAIYLTTPCPRADFNRDGVRNVFDFIAFGNAYAANDPRADLDGNGVLNVFDFIALGNAYGSCAR